VNSVSVIGKEPQDAQAIFESSCTSLGKVVLHIDRPNKGMMHLKTKLALDLTDWTCGSISAHDGSITKTALKVMIRLPLCRPGMPRSLTAI
jgi:hypothetical protein